MDSIGWIIVLLFLGIIGFAIYVSQKNSSAGGTYVPPTPPTPAPKPPDPVPSKKEEPKYISIYEYTPVQTVKRCAYCDGENNHGSKVCCICGNDIDS